MQVNDEKTEIRINIDNLFLRGGVVVGIDDLIKIFQYSVDEGLVNAIKRKGKVIVSIKGK